MKYRSIRLTFVLAMTLLSLGHLAGQEAEGLPAKPLQAGTGDQLVLDLQGAVDYAVAYNKNLQNARLELESAERSIWETIAQGLPQVDGTLDYMTYFNYELEFNFGGGEAPSFSPEDLQSAFEQTQQLFPFYTQNDVALHAADSYYDGVLQSMLPPNTIVLGGQSSAKLQLSQLLFSGQYILGIQTARLARQISEENLEFNILETKGTVIASYYLCLITEESLHILEQNLANLEETFQQTETMYETGMAEQTDVDQIRVSVNQVIDARNALQRNLELNYNLLRFQLGIDPATEIILTDKLEELFVSTQAESALDTSFDLESNLTYQLMSTQEKINEKMLGLEKWNYAPTISGFYNYNAKILTTDFDMNPNHLAGFNLSLPIFSSGMRKARVDQARINLQMTQNNKSILEDQLRIQEKQYQYNLQSSLENYITQKENVEVAQRVYDSYRRKYEQGMATSLDLTQANSAYLDAQSAYLNAILEVMNAKLQLDKLINAI